jgi:hypothetical protein
MSDRVSANTTHPHVLPIIAHAFDMPAADIRVLSRFLGGGFGCKGQLWWPWMHFDHRDHKGEPTECSQAGNEHKLTSNYPKAYQCAKSVAFIGTQWLFEPKSPSEREFSRKWPETFGDGSLERERQSRHNPGCA